MHLLVNELSKVTGTNIETIRGYRKAGFLHPVQNPNNKYYYYTDQDIYLLFQIKRLRQSNTPLQAIRNYVIDDTNPVEVMEKIIQEKQKRLEQLKMEIEGNQRYLDTLKDCLEKEGIVDFREHQRFKYDIPLLQTLREEPEVYEKWLSNIQRTPLSLHINMKEFSGDKNAEDPVPLVICLGSYGELVREFNLPLPSEYYLAPPGEYLSVIVKKKAGEKILYGDLKPMVDYANEHHLRFTTDTTAFLMLTLQNDGVTFNFYRIRIGVKS